MFKLPPRLYNSEGLLRRVGVELEFSGLSLTLTASLVARAVNGKWRQTGDYTCDVYSSFGEFHIEFDSSFFKKKTYAKYLNALGLNPEDSAFGKKCEETLNRLGEIVIPFEVVTPPLPITHMEVVESIREELRLHSAKGTRSAPLRAFGLQFNPELPDFKVETILAHMRAFFVLFDSIYEESEIPLARKVAPYIHSFPDGYVETISDPEYRPDLKAFMTDYLKFNPTRNRPLDLLPLFAHLDPALVFQFPVEKDLVKPRPTFHYRLPNSQIDDLDWTIAREWNRWAAVETLAADAPALSEASQDLYVALKRRDLNRQEWIEKTRGHLHV